MLVLWDLADPAHPRRVGEASAGTGRLVGTGTSAALSPDGGVLAAAFGESVLLWDLADPHAPRLLDTPLAASASFLAFDPVGRVLAVLVSGDDGSGQLVLWDLADPARPQQLGSPLEASGAAVTFSQDGKIMAFSGADGTVNLWDVTTPARPQPVDAPRIDPTPLVALAPDGHTIAAVGRDNRIRLWDVSDKGQARAVGEPLGGMNSLAFSADSRLLATVSNSDRNVSLWDLAGGAPVQRVAPPPPDPASVDEVTPIFPGDLRRPMTSAVADHLLARTAGGKVYLCDLEDPGGNCSDTIPDTTAATGATFVRGARLLAVFSRAGGTGTVALWDVGDRSRPQHVGQFTVGLAGPVSDSPPSTPGSPPTTSGDPTFEPVPPSSSMPVTMAVAPDGRTLATIVSQQGPNGSSSGSAILWDIANPTLPQKMGELPDVSTMSFTGVPGSAATVDGNGAVHFWDVSSSPPNHVGTLPADTSSVLALGGGILALTGEDAASVALWDVSDMTQPRPVSTLPTDGDVTAALSDDARTLAVGSLSGDIQLWDLTDPGQPRTLGPPLTAATPDGLTPSAVLLDDAGQTLAAIGTDSTVAIWNLAPLADIRDHAVAHACMVTRAGLDHDEWARFVPSLEYVDVCAP